MSFSLLLLLRIFLCLLIFFLVEVCQFLFKMTRERPVDSLVYDHENELLDGEEEVGNVEKKYEAKRRTDEN